ncbi:MAG: rhodanese-like domain-containing protein [Acidobacteriota bacterium]
MAQFTRYALIVPFVLALSAAAWGQALRNIPRVTVDEARALLAKKQVLFIDNRTMEEFEAGHLPGAVHVPFVDIEYKANALLKEKRQIIAYCA